MLNELKLKYPDFDENISRYRLWEMYEGAKIAQELLKGGFDPQYIRGSMEMLKKILHLPLKWGTTKTSKEMASNMVKRDLKEFHSRFVRLFVE